jgi:hypothetical protein
VFSCSHVFKYFAFQGLFYVYRAENATDSYLVSTVEYYVELKSARQAELSGKMHFHCELATNYYIPAFASLNNELNYRYSATLVNRNGG